MSDRDHSSEWATLIEAVLAAAPRDAWEGLWRAVNDLSLVPSTERYSTHPPVVRPDAYSEPVIVMGGSSYCPAVDEIHARLYELGVMKALRIHYPSASDLPQFEAGLTDGSAAEAFLLLAVLTRQERFGAGAINTALETGAFEAALQRLRDWYEEQELYR